MRILLVNPPLLAKERYGKRLSKLGPVSEPMGLAYIASVLEKNGNKVDIIDTEAMNYSTEGFKSWFKNKKGMYNIVGVTITTPMYIRAIEVIRIIREIDNGAKIIVGGPHVTILPERTLEENPQIDLGIVGEGEITIIELINAIKQKGAIEDIAGIVYRRNGNIFLTSFRQHIKKLDDIPFPSRHLLPMYLYKPTVSYYKRLPSYLIITSRGCPFHCAYCSQIFGHTFRYHSKERVIEEMQILLKDYNAKEIIIRDDTFTSNQARVEELCNEMIKRKLNIRWSCATRVDCVSPNLLKLMRKAGCWGIHYGVESGTQRLLDIIEKGITLKQIIDAFKWTEEAKIEIRAYFMIGLSTETKEETERTINFAKELNPFWAQFTITTPYPGTKLFKIAQKDGTLKSFNWENYQSWAGWADTDLVYVPLRRDAQELKKCQRLAIKRFYLSPKTLLRHIKSIDSWHSFKNYIQGALTLIKT